MELRLFRYSNFRYRSQSQNNETESRKKIVGRNQPLQLRNAIGTVSLKAKKFVEIDLMC